MNPVIDPGTAELALTEEQRILLGIVDDACRRIRPFEDQCYLQRVFNRRMVEILRESHLLGLPISEKYGDGQGADLVTYTLALERIGREGTGVRSFLSGHISLGQITVERWGSEGVKEKYLPRATRGERIFAFGLTEPTAGSDPASLRSTFEEVDRGYLITGTKAWITNAPVADAMIVFAYPKGRSEEMCSFVVEKDSEGLELQEQKHKMGIPTTATGMIFMDGCLVPKENLLGPPGRGLSVAYSALMYGRLSVAAGSLGVMRDCLDEALEYSRTRVQHGKPIGRHQLVQRHIAIMATNLESARLLTYRAAMALQLHHSNPTDIKARERADTLVAQAKYLASKLAYDSADRAVQIFGANGYSLETRVARHLCDTRVCRIYEGTEEILELKIASDLLGESFRAYR